MAEPHRWAAIVPICGASNPKFAEKIKDIPCWVFHGASDKIIPVYEKIYEDLLSEGPRPG